MLMKTPLFAGLLTLGLIAQAADARQSSESDGQTAPEIENGEDSEKEKSTTWSVSGGDIYQFDTDIKGGASFAVNRV